MLTALERDTRAHRHAERHQVLAALEKWEKDRRELNELDVGSPELPEKFEMTAMKCIVPLQSKLRDFIEERENELDTVDKLRNAIVQ